MKTTRTAIRLEDNDQIQAWARQASVNENKPVFSADILNRLIKKHIKDYKNEPPTDGSKEAS